jgi:hypothetical protein
VVAFRKTGASTVDQGATAAWLRQGEIQASEIDCEPYDERRFRAALRQIRALTVEPPDVFQPEVVRLCAAAGVAVVFVPELPRTGICGATRWLTPTKALLQLSLRHKSDDHLWFSFFHEAGHILLHRKREAFFEQVHVSGGEEDEANDFARDLLILSTGWHRFTQSDRYNAKTAILAFAEEIGVAPGIVVGRLQHEGLVLHRNCNDLKRWFAWAETTDDDDEGQTT